MREEKDKYFVVTTTPITVTFLVNAKDECEAKKIAEAEIDKCYFGADYTGRYWDGEDIEETQYVVYKLPPKGYWGDGKHK